MGEYGFDHLHFKCSDVEVMAKFLTENFGGIQLAKNTGGSAPMIRMKVGGQTLLLSGKGPNDQIEGDMSQRRYGLDHWGLSVTDLDAAYEDLTAKGVRFTLPPTAYSSLRIAFLLSPDNVQIELLERK